jgi:hypothetical protein
MNIAYLDCPTGASGDMLLGALIDAGFSTTLLRETIRSLNTIECQLEVLNVVKNGIHATQVKILANETSPTRHLEDMLFIIEHSQLDSIIKTRAQQMFVRLAEVEARIHDTSIEQVHFHELSGVDTIVDIVGFLVGLHSLEIETLFASPIPLGRGFVNSAHGRLPLPAPATLALLEGVKVVGSEIDKELVTPTGALLLSSLVKSFGAIEPMVLRKVGYGAGQRDLPIPNVVRVLIGESIEGKATIEDLVMLETNIDNLNPEVYDYLITRLLSAGALDVTVTNIIMKKNRPAVQLSVLVPPGIVQSIQRIIFDETTTLGIRHYKVERHALPRQIHVVETNYGQVRVKIAERGEGKKSAAPEYEDCRRLAEQTGQPLITIYQAALSAAINDIQANKESPS